MSVILSRRISYFVGGPTNIIILQVLASVSSGLMMSGISGTFGYPAVALPQLTGTNHTLELSTPQASWFGE